MDLEHEQTNLPYENRQSLHLFSESSLPSSELISKSISPFNLQMTFNFDNKLIKKLDFRDSAQKNIIKKPPITCPSLISKESIDKFKFGIQKTAQISLNHLLQNKEMSNNCCSLSNQSTDISSVELPKTPIEFLKISQNLPMRNEFVSSKAIKPSLKNENSMLKLKLPFKNKGENIPNNPFIIKKSDWMNLNNNKKLSDFFQSPNSVLSQNYNQTEKKVKISSIFENEFEKIEVLYFRIFSFNLSL